MPSSARFTRSTVSRKLPVRRTGAFRSGVPTSSRPVLHGNGSIRSSVWITSIQIEPNRMRFNAPLRADVAPRVPRIPTVRSSGTRRSRSLPARSSPPGLAIGCVVCCVISQRQRCERRANSPAKQPTGEVAGLHFVGDEQQTPGPEDAPRSDRARSRTRRRSARRDRDRSSPRRSSRARRQSSSAIPISTSSTSPLEAHLVRALGRDLEHPGVDVDPPNPGAASRGAQCERTGAAADVEHVLPERDAAREAVVRLGHPAEGQQADAEVVAMWRRFQHPHQDVGAHDRWKL